MSESTYDWALKAVVEAVMNHTVGIVVQDTDLATGVLISLGQQPYIATARHVINGIPEDQIRFMFRPGGTLLHTPRLADVREMMGRRFTSLPILRTAFSSDQDDLALLEVSAEDVEQHGVWPYVFGSDSASPALGEEVFVVGFPVDLVRDVTTRAGERGKGVLPFVYVTEVARGETLEAHAYIPELHFAMAFQPQDDELEFKRPHGLSGGGVWIPPTLQERGVWSPDKIRLAGIQVGWFRQSKLLKAVKVQRLAALLLGLSPG